MADGRNTVRVGSAGIVEDSDGRILMALRGTYPKDIWVLPGGGVDFGETAAEAFVREIAEETGLVVADPELVEVRELIRKDLGIHRVIFFYRARARGGDMRPGDDVSELRWMAVDEIVSTENLGDTVLPVLKAAGYI